MTKLLQWLTFLFAFLAVWTSILFDCLPVQLDRPAKEVVWMIPVYLLILFACYSLAMIGYRVATFNDCAAAAEELKHQISEARADLSSRGFKFVDQQSHS